MTLRRAVLLCLGSIGIATIVVVTVVHRVPQQHVPASTSAPADVDAIAALQRDIALLRKQVQAQVNQAHAVALPGPPTQDPDASRDRIERDPAPPGARPLEPAQIGSLLEVHHAREPVDRAWSDKLRAELSSALDTHLARTTVSAVQCGTSLCKVSLQHENLDAQRELAGAVASLPCLRSGVFYSYQDEEKSPRTVLYVVREGQDINEIVAAQ